MITRGPRQTPGTVEDRIASLRNTLGALGGRQLFETTVPAATASDGRFEMWMVEGRFVLVQIFADGQGLDVYYPSPSMQMNDLIAELRAYVAQGWPALRAGGVFR